MTKYDDIQERLYNLSENLHGANIEYEALCRLLENFDKKFMKEKEGEAVDYE